MTKKFALTGGNGFIGNVLAKALLARGHSVRILSRYSRESSDPRVEYLTVDYKDPQVLEYALAGCDGVFHLAAAIFAHNYAGFEEANVITTQNIAAAAKKTAGLEYFIYMSSQAAGGFSIDHNNPRTEADAPVPVSDYGRTKLGGEMAVASLPANIKTVIFRPPVVYGKNDSGVSKIAAWVKRGLMVNTSKGDAYFNFIHVDDLVAALLKALDLPAAYGQTFYVCENKSYTWRFFIDSMASAMESIKKRQV